MGRASSGAVVSLSLFKACLLLVPRLDSVIRRVQLEVSLAFGIERLASLTWLACRAHHCCCLQVEPSNPTRQVLLSWVVHAESPIHVFDLSCVFVDNPRAQGVIRLI